MDKDVDQSFESEEGSEKMEDYIVRMEGIGKMGQDLGERNQVG